MRPAGVTTSRNIKVLLFEQIRTGPNPQSHWEVKMDVPQTPRGCQPSLTMWPWPELSTTSLALAREVLRPSPFSQASTADEEASTAFTSAEIKRLLLLLHFVF